MASGRPVVITPRTETRRIVEACDAGLVAGGDSADELAEAIRMLLLDGALAARLGANGRVAAERTYDWRVIASSVAEGVLERVPGGVGGAA
jgi:glycosyltransferase involved in cell wall biosynthesis